MEEIKFNNDAPKEEYKPEPTNYDNSPKPNKSNLTDTCRKNPWIVSTLILGVLSLILLAGSFGITGNTISEKDIGQQLLEFYESTGAQGLELQSVETVSGVYQVTFKYNGQDVPIFATKDGKFAGSLSPLSAPKDEPTKPTPTEVPKSDKPTAELFVMTHCPFGTQAEKGFLPMMREMDNLADLKIRFVHYFMHTNDQEDVETPRQVCIREEQPEKFYDYLECFLGGTAGTPEEASACEAQTGIDSTALADCIDSGRGDEYYETDSEASEGYGVQGSPTLIINGAQSNAGRDAASYLAGVCSAFNNAPAECASLNLPSDSPAPGFGWDGSGAAGGSAAQCA